MRLPNRPEPACAIYLLPNRRQGLAMKVVCVVDDEPQVRKSLANLLRSAGYQAVCFASGEGFLASEWRTRAMALVLDMHMPGLQSADVQCRLK